MCIYQFLQVFSLGSLWNSFIFCRFPLGRVTSGFSELLIICLISLELPLSLPAWTVSYKETYFPLEMPLHDMTSKEMAIPMRPASKKKKIQTHTVSYHKDQIVTPRLSPRQTIPLNKIKIIFTWLEYVNVCVIYKRNDPWSDGILVYSWYNNAGRIIWKHHKLWLWILQDRCCEWLSSKHTVFHVCCDLLQFSRVTGPAPCTTTQQNSSSKSKCCKSKYKYSQLLMLT